MSSNSSCLYFLIFCLLNFANGNEQTVEVSYNINLKKHVQCVGENFLSISVDPAVLLAGVNLSENTLRLAKHLSPAFIRFAGPSTQFIKYDDHGDDNPTSFLADDGNSFKITPALWFGLTEWLKLAKLMPVFAINDAETSRGLWNPKDTLPLFEISENLNISCYWQLGYDSSDKNETRYKQDINIFHYILTAYGARNDTWKIIGSDISTLPADRIENIMMEESDVVEAVMWEPSGRELETFPEKDAAYKILSRASAKPRTKMWTTIPKSSEPVRFSSALLWAKQVGNAAKMGYDVIFRQPRLYELFTDTPIYWFSVLHKQLMGCHVLDAKSSMFQEEIDIFAHCTRKQNSFVRRGALTVLIVNDRQGKYKVKVKLGNSLPEKSMEIQSYVLTSDNRNSTKIYLNGKLLTTKQFQEKIPFQPKIRRTKTSSHILLSLPPASIGFFVLPGARVPVCIDKEKETHLLLEEIEENQNNGLSEEIALQLGSRASFTRNNMLQEITKKLKDEMQSDEKYYKKASVKSEGKFSENHGYETHKLDGKVDEKGRKLFIDRVKLAEIHKKAMELQKKPHGLKAWFDKSKTIKEPKTEKKPKNMDLTSQEIENILKVRAVERAAKKNIVFTDEELDALIHKASKNFNMPKNRIKRGVNRELLEKYSEDNQQAFLDFQEKDFDPKPDNVNVRHKRDVHKIKKRVRGARGINFNLLDLKSKIAEHKQMWKNKKDSLLGNSNTLKENIKDKIRELKSRRRFRRDISKDVLRKGSKKLKKAKKPKTEIIPPKEVEATVREEGQTTAEILEEWERTHAADDAEEEKVEEVFKGEVYAELADSEDLEDDLLLKEPPPKPKKLSIFNKKAKIDPFAVAHPAIDIVEPPPRKSKKKKSKAQNDLQFLTTSEEFTDIEDDLPSIHEYFGPKNKQEKKKSSSKSGVQEINEFYDIPRLVKRDVHQFKPEDVPRIKRSIAGLSIVETGLFEDDLHPEDLLQDVLFDPVLELPIPDQLFFYETMKQNGNNKMIYNNELPMLDKIILQKMEIKLLNSTEETNNSDSFDIHTGEDNADKLDTPADDLKNNSENLQDSPTEDISKNDIILGSNNQEDFSTSGLKYLSDNALHKDDYGEEKVNEKDNKSDDIGSLQSLSEEPKNDENYGEATEEASLSLDTLDTEDIEKVDKSETSESNQIESTQLLRRKRRDTNSVEQSEENLKKKKKPTGKSPKKSKQEITKKEHKKLKEKLKKKNENKYLTEQMNIIRDKLQERKDEIDKMLKKQKQIEQGIKDQWKDKLAKKKATKTEKTEDGIVVSSRSKAEKKLRPVKPCKQNRKKRSVLEPKVVFGNYQPPVMKKWRPSDILSLKRDIHFPKKLTPPDDSQYFKNIFKKNKSLKLRRKRFSDNYVDSLENDIDGFTNDIKEDPFIFNLLVENKPDTNLNTLETEISNIGDKNNKLKTITEDVIFTPETKNDVEEVIQKINEKDDLISNIEIIPFDNNINKDTDFDTVPKNNDIKTNDNENSIKDGDYKFKLPNNDEFEIIKVGDDTELKFLHHNQHPMNNFSEGTEDSAKKENTTFIPKITPRSMKPFEDIGAFFENIKKLFDKVGKEVKNYFSDIGLRF